MKLNLASKIGIGLTVVGLIGFGGVMLLPSKAPPNCRSLVLERANKVTQKMIMPNGDGGVFLLSRGPEPMQIVFYGFIGPTTATTLQSEMIEVGLQDVRVGVSGHCSADNGLLYTVVYGAYKTAPQPQPEPQEPI